MSSCGPTTRVDPLAHGRLPGLAAVLAAVDPAGELAVDLLAGRGDEEAPPAPLFASQPPQKSLIGVLPGWLRALLPGLAGVGAAKHRVRRRDVPVLRILARIERVADHLLVDARRPRPGLAGVVAAPQALLRADHQHRAQSGRSRTSACTATRPATASPASPVCQVSPLSLLICSMRRAVAARQAVQHLGVLRVEGDRIGDRPADLRRTAASARYARHRCCGTRPTCRCCRTSGSARAGELTGQKIPPPPPRPRFTHSFCAASAVEITTNGRTRTAAASHRIRMSGSCAKAARIAIL